MTGGQVMYSKLKNEITESIIEALMKLRVKVDEEIQVRSFCFNLFKV